MSLQKKAQSYRFLTEGNQLGSQFQAMMADVQKSFPIIKQLRDKLYAHQKYNEANTLQAVETAYTYLMEAWGTAATPGVGSPFFPPYEPQSPEEANRRGLPHELQPRQHAYDMIQWYKQVLFAFEQRYQQFKATADNAAKILNDHAKLFSKYPSVAKSLSNAANTTLMGALIATMKQYIDSKKLEMFPPDIVPAAEPQAPGEFIGAPAAGAAPKLDTAPNKTILGSGVVGKLTHKKNPSTKLYIYDDNRALISVDGQDIKLSARDLEEFMKTYVSGHESDWEIQTKESKQLIQNITKLANKFEKLAKY